MLRRPPRSTPFPTRRSSDLGKGVIRVRHEERERISKYRGCLIKGHTVLSDVGLGLFPKARRSEEHTSELQSPYDLVCRLLLEKKKKKTNIHHTQLRQYNNLP